MLLYRPPLSQSPPLAGREEVRSHRTTPLPTPCTFVLTMLLTSMGGGATDHRALSGRRSLHAVLRSGASRCQVSPTLCAILSPLLHPPSTLTALGERLTVLDCPLRAWERGAATRRGTRMNRLPTVHSLDGSSNGPRSANTSLRYSLTPPSSPRHAHCTTCVPHCAGLPLTGMGERSHYPPRDSNEPPTCSSLPRREQLWASQR